ncbi:MAG TPA: FAD-dependent oxidoreductase [bacterium]|nr:FAD-dependent oxidoreductase [bacterium]
MFPELFKPGSIGFLSLKNRVVMACISHHFAEDSYVTPRMIHFFQERARGGAGLIIAGPYQADQKTGLQNLMYPGIGEERFLPGLKSLAEAVHEAGAAVAFQLFHAGKYADPKIIGTQPVSASAIPSPHSRSIPRELTVAEIKEIQRQFVEDIDRGKRAGFDAVEINACSGYLTREFLSPLTNQRTDEYGGSLENRLRFLLEIIALARREVGAYPLIVRITAHECLLGGHGLEEAKQIATALEEAGVDAIHVTVGGHETSVPLTPAMVPRGAFMPLIAEVKKVVNRIPVIGGVRINHPFVAEEAISEGQVDFISRARALIIDPFFPKKAQEGRIDEISFCIACQQGCYDRLFAGDRITCTVNARAGYEGEREIGQSGHPKRVLVIGGGPGGMEAARVAALRGHRVTLWEKKKSLGGQFRLAAALEEKKEYLNLISYLETQLRILGVEVVLEKEATAQDILALQPDVLVVASGARPISPKIPGATSAGVVQAHEVLAERIPVGERVIVIGGGGVGCDTALLLASAGESEMTPLQYLQHFQLLPGEEPANGEKPRREVTLIEMLPRVGTDIGRTTRWSTLMTLKEHGIKILTETRAEEITSEGVWVTGNDGRKFLPADTVVLAIGALPESRLFEELEGKIPEVHLVGDASKPRKALDAIHEAFLTASRI